MSNKSILPADYTPNLATTTPSVQFRTNLGPSYCSNATLATGDCVNATGGISDLGSITITFSRPVTNPTIHLAGLGGVVGATSFPKANLTLTGPGVTLGAVSPSSKLVAVGNTIKAATNNTSTTCNTATPAGCGSVAINGTVSSLTFAITGSFYSSGAPAVNSVGITDAYNITATLGEDYGDAPASYEAGNPGVAVISDVRLGAAVTAEEAALSSALADGDSDDDTYIPAPITANASSLQQTYAVSGVSADARVCSWIDFDHSGTFDIGERACSTVSAGANTVTLNWATLPTMTSGDMYQRIRIGYNTTQTESPTGISDSGEIEDYIVKAVLIGEDDTATTPQDTPVTIDVLANDPTGAMTTISSVTNGAHGTVTIVNNKVVYTPDTGYAGTDTFTYTACTPQGDCVTQTVTVTITPVTVINPPVTVTPEPSTPVSSTPDPSTTLASTGQNTVVIPTLALLVTAISAGILWKNRLLRHLK